MAISGLLTSWVGAWVGGDAGGPLGSLLFLFSYFTIWTNTAVALVFGALALGRTGWLTTPFLRGGVTTWILVVALVYHILLSALNPIDSVWDSVGNGLTHYVVPAAVVLHWLVFGPRDVGWSWPFAWLLFPLLYTAFGLTLGALTGRYAYPFLDLPALGMVGLVREVGVLVVGFTLAGLAVVGVAKLLPKRA